MNEATFPENKLETHCSSQAQATRFGISQAKKLSSWGYPHAFLRADSEVFERIEVNNYPAGFYCPQHAERTTVKVVVWKAVLHPLSSKSPTVTDKNHPDWDGAVVTTPLNF